MFNRVVHNPGFAGHHLASNFTFASRSQWVGLEGNPNTFAFTFSKPWYRGRGNIGAYALGDRIGPFSSVTVKAAYNYKWQPGGEGGNALQIGLALGVIQTSLDGSNWRPPQTLAAADPVLIQGAGSATTFDIDFGVTYLAPDDKYYIGLALNHLTEPSLSALTENNSSMTRKSRGMNLMAGYRFNIRRGISLMPSILMRSTSLQPALTQMDIGGTFTVSPMVFGITYRIPNTAVYVPNAVAAIIGFQASKKLFVAYSYDYTTSALGAAVSGSHEIVISYTLERIFRLFPANLSPSEKRDFR